MNAKEYLQQLQRLDTVINQKIQEIQDLRLKLQSTKSVDYSEKWVQTNRFKDAPFVRLIGKIIDLEAEINFEINIFIDKKHEIINQIQGLKNVDYINLLYKRYVEYKNLECICVEMNFSYGYIKHLHGYALKSFEDKILNLTPNST